MQRGRGHVLRGRLDIGRRAAARVIISHHKCAGPANYGRSRDTLALIDRAVAQDQAVSFDVYPYIASSTSLLPRFVRDAESSSGSGLSSRCWHLPRAPRLGRVGT